LDFVQYISTAVGRDVSNPLTTTLKLTRGRLTSGFLFFPSGPAGTLHFLARIGIHQIIPFNTGQNLRLDDCVVPFTLGIDLLEPPYQVECITWNDSILYAHVLTVCFSLVPKVKKKYDLKTLINDFAGTEGYHKP